VSGERDVDSVGARGDPVAGVGDRAGGDVRDVGCVRCFLYMSPLERSLSLSPRR
jgi:hypothetical protein